MDDRVLVIKVAELRNFTYCMRWKWLLCCNQSNGSRSSLRILQCFASKFLAKNDKLQFELFLELYSSLFRSLPSHRNLFHLDQDKGLSEEIGRKVIITVYFRQS